MGLLSATYKQGAKEQAREAPWHSQSVSARLHQGGPFRSDDAPLANGQPSQVRAALERGSFYIYALPTSNLQSINKKGWGLSLRCFRDVGYFAPASGSEPEGLRLCKRKLCAP
eukprot:1153451-Pelagomonas_calceolata.AAC.3